MPWFLPTLLAFGLLGITLLGVGAMYYWNGQAIGWDSATFWLGGFGGAMIVFLVAIWLGFNGERRPTLGGRCGRPTFAGLLSLADFLLPNVVKDLPIHALLSDRAFGGRLAGAIASPNAMVSLLVAPTAIFAAALVLAVERRWRVAALVLLPALLVTLALTYSRSAILAVFAIAVIVLWRWRRPVGIGLLIIGMIVGAVLTPFYLQARGKSWDRSCGPARCSSPATSNGSRPGARRAGCGSTSRSSATASGATRSSPRRYGDQVLGSPHNEWIRLFAEEGVVAESWGSASPWRSSSTSPAGPAGSPSVPWARSSAGRSPPRSTTRSCSSRSTRSRSRSPG